MGIRLVCSDLDGTLLQYGKKNWKARFLTRSGHFMTGDPVLPGVWKTVYQSAEAVRSGGGLLYFLM
ncbi:hypothetical protein [Waltera sp.]|uniref:hypothetical protein n=1 Tax=Waltera sp. TaxID=2815806 RepID=UPI00399F0DED